MELEVITHEPNTPLHPTPILFVHGAYQGAWCWAEYFLPYFAGHGYTVQALSLRSHGSSAGRSRLRWTRIAAYVDDVAQVAGQWPEPPILIGHSMGGFVVQKYLERYPAPAAVLLASMPPSGMLKPFLRLARRHPLALLKSCLTLSPYQFINTPGLTRDAFFSTDMPTEQVERYFERLQDETIWMLLDTLAFQLPRPERIKVPMLVLGGTDDTLITPAEIEATGRAYNAPVKIFPHMAHDLMLEEGWRDVADCILQWLDQ
jgi:pimeloyl-ACP methyl ester carboxylesterase